MEAYTKKMEHVSRKSVQLARFYKVLKFRKLPNLFKVSSFQLYFSANSMISLVEWRPFGYLLINLKDSLVKSDQNMFLLSYSAKHKSRQS